MKRPSERGSDLRCRYVGRVGPTTVLHTAGASNFLDAPAALSQLTIFESSDCFGKSLNAVFASQRYILATRRRGRHNARTSVVCQNIFQKIWDLPGGFTRNFSSFVKNIYGVVDPLPNPCFCVFQVCSFCSQNSESNSLETVADNKFQKSYRHEKENIEKVRSSYRRSSRTSSRAAPAFNRSRSRKAQASQDGRNPYPGINYGVCH